MISPFKNAERGETATFQPPSASLNRDTHTRTKPKGRALEPSTTARRRVFVKLHGIESTARRIACVRTNVARDKPSPQSLADRRRRTGSAKRVENKTADGDTCTDERLDELLRVRSLAAAINMRELRSHVPAADGDAEDVARPIGIFWNIVVFAGLGIRRRHGQDIVRSAYRIGRVRAAGPSGARF